MATLNLGNGYSIDLAEADAFVQTLQDAKDRLKDTLQGTAFGLQVLAPGHDDYSGVFANAYNGVIEQHRAWNEKKQAELQELIDKVTATVSSYRQTEQNNTPRV